MSRETIGLSEDLQHYLVSHSARESDVQRRLREETADHPQRDMQIAPEQAQLMAVLARMVDARLALEVGVFTGYSALSVAAALPPDGRLVACDINEEFAETARRYWVEAGVSDKIELRIGPAEESLNALIDDGYRNRFDFAFIDADKTSYPTYYRQCLALLRPGGILLIDNVFASGYVTDAETDDPSVLAIRMTNAMVAHDESVDACIIPIADGLTLARKR